MSAVVSVRKIALATWFPRDPESPVGGVESVSVTLARALARQAGTEIHIVTVDSCVDAPEQQEWSGLIVHRLPRGPGSLLRFATSTGARMVQDYLRDLKPDLVHAHDTFGIMTRGLNLPRVFTIHGFIHEDTRLKGGWRSRLQAALWKREELATWAEQPHIIAISPYVRERLRGIARGVIHDIENPVNEACFDVPRNEQPGRIFSAAVISARKNPKALVEALALLCPGADVRLRLAGRVVDADYGEALKALIQARGLRDRVELLGNLPTTCVREEIAKAAVFALTSLEEGAPMGIAEAMAAGVPIVTSNRCGMPYMVRNGETGFLVNPDDPEDISRSLECLITDTNSRLRMGAAARQFSKDRFDPGRVAEKTMRVYESAMATRLSSLFKSPC